MSAIEVAIGPHQAPGRFRVEVVRSPDGEASALTDLDVDALLGRRAELEQVVLVSTVPTRKVFPAEQRVQDVGNALFRALLGTGEVAGRYRAAAALAAHSGEGLRVVLRIDDPTLAGLPWEAMYDEAVGSYVSGGTSWSVTWVCPRPLRRCRLPLRCASWGLCPPRAAWPPWTWIRKRTS